MSAQSHHLVLPREPASAGLARRFIRSVLHELGLEPLVDSTELAVTELVTNAVLHGRSPVEVDVRATCDGLRVGVSDGSPVVPAERDYGKMAMTGRGLGLVADLAREVGVDPRDDGKTAWFVMSLVEEPEPEQSEDPAEVDRWSQQVSALLVSGLPIVLVGLPVALWQAVQPHHDALLRELLMHRLEHTGVDLDVRADIVQADAAQSRLALAVDETLAAAGLPLPDHIDVDLVVEASAVADYPVLQDVLDEAERLAVEGHLLTLPTLAESVALRDWFCEQVVSQSQGVAASRWLARRAAPTPERFDVPLPAWDASGLAAETGCVVVADDHNRILGVSPGLTEQLGWEEHDLVGRRVVTLVPPRLREAHVAGFARHLSTGEARILGTDTVLPVALPGGGERLFRCRIDGVPAERGRTVFLARLVPLD